MKEQTKPNILDFIIQMLRSNPSADNSMNEEMARQMAPVPGQDPILGPDVPMGPQPAVAQRERMMNNFPGAGR